MKTNSKYRFVSSNGKNQLKNNEVIYSKTIFPNGLKVISEEIKTTSTFALGVFINAGSNRDYKYRDGLAHFVEHASFRKTRKISGRKLNTAFESIGAYTNAFTTKEVTCYYVRAMHENFKPCLRLLSEIILYPVYLEKDIEKERAIIMEEIKSYEDEPEEVIFDYGDIILFDKHPLSHPIVGSQKSVKQIQTNDIENFHNQFYSPNNIVISYAGPLQHTKLLDIVWQFFYNSPKNEISFSETLDFSYLENKPKLSIYKKRFNQTHLLLNRVVEGMNSEDRYKISALNFILGEGLSSRLHKKLREDKSLVYTIYSSLQLFKTIGSLSIYAAGEKNKYEEIRNIIENELNNLAKNGITKLELKIAKEQLKSNTIMALESLSARIQNLAKSELTLGRNESIKEIIDNIDSITQDELNYLSNIYFHPGKWNQIIFI